MAIGVGVFRIAEDRNHRSCRDQLPQQLDSLCTKRSIELSYFGDVPSRTVETGHHAERDRLGAHDKDDGYRCGRCFGRQCCRQRCSKDHSHRSIHQLGRHRSQTVVIAVGPTKFDRDVQTFNAGFREALAECGHATRALMASDKPLRNPIMGRVGCCARAPRGDASAAPPRSAMNFRRFIRSPRRCSNCCTAISPVGMAASRRSMQRVATHSTLGGGIEHRATEPHSCQVAKLRDAWIWHFSDPASLIWHFSDPASLREDDRKRK